MRTSPEGSVRRDSADALIEVFRRAAALTGERSGRAVPTVIFHVDGDGLAGADGGLRRTARGDPLSPAAARRLACDAMLVPWIMRSGKPVYVGRALRTVPPHVRRIVEWRQQGMCAEPGCDRPIAHVHHEPWWTNGGPTATTSAVGVCHGGHTALHDGTLVVRGNADEAGGLRWYRGDGTPIGDHPPLPDPHLPSEPRPAAYEPRWDGAPCGEHALSVLACRLLQADGYGITPN